MNSISDSDKVSYNGINIIPDIAHACIISIHSILFSEYKQTIGLNVY